MTLPLHSFLPVWALLALNIASPGPNVLNTMTTAMGSGRRAALASALGVAVGIAIWCLAMTLGTAALFRAVPAARVAMTLAAIALLVIFARRFIRGGLRALRSGQTMAVGRQQNIGVAQSFLRSLSVNATNPKALTTWVAILALFPTDKAGAGDLALLGAGAAATGLLVHSAYALAFSTPPAARLWSRAAPWINLGVGAFFLAFATRLLVSLLP